MEHNIKPKGVNAPLNSLKEMKIWTARGAPGTLKDKVGNPVSKRAPITPATGRLALNNKPGTWGTRSAAEKRAAKFGPDAREPGVGLMLGAHHAPEGYVRAGIDADGCRDPLTGDIENWAKKIIWQFQTYTEASPSGEGLHLVFHVKADDMDALRAEGLLSNLGKTFVQGEHVEIATFFGGKFLTVTDDLHCDLMGEYDRLRVVSLDDLRWLLGEFGPSWARNAEGTSSSRADDSGSGHGYRLVMDQMREGLDDDAVGEALAEDDGEAGNWWNRTDDRQRRRALGNARKRVEQEAAEFDDLLDEFDEDESDGGEAKDGTPSILNQMNRRHAVTYMGGSAAVADFGNEGIEFRSFAAFREINRNRKVGGRKLGDWWLEHPKRRTYDRGVIFDPSGQERRSYLNLWTGWAVNPDPDADCGMILEYIRDVVAAGDSEHADYILSWLADIVRRPASKPGVAMVLKGLKGVGKDTLAEIMSAIIGRRHVAHYANAERITDKFNAQLAESLLIHAEEAAWGGDRKNKGTLQSLITAPTVDLERKGLDVQRIDSFHRLLFTTNEVWSVPATADERRYAVFNVSDCRQGQREYWTALYSQIHGEGPAGFLAHLLAWKRPAGIELRNPPKTSGLAGEKLAGLRNADAWWFGLLTEEDLPGCGWTEDADDNGEWEDCSQTVDKAALRGSYEAWWSAERHAGDRLSPAAFGKALHRLCPEVTETKQREATGGRTRCYRLPPLSVCRVAFAQAMGIEPEDCPWNESEC